MNSLLRTAWVVAGVAIAAQAAAQVTFYEGADFTGRTFTTDREVVNLSNYGFNDRASSVVVARDQWEICEAARFGGRCVVLGPGRYPSLAAMGLNDRISSTRFRTVAVDDRKAPPQVTFYEQENFAGRSFTSEREVKNFADSGFNDRASSVVVHRGGWEICPETRYLGRCVVLGPGRYPSLAAMGLNDRISSMRFRGQKAPVSDNRDALSPMAAQITFYERAGFGGRSFTTEKQVGNFSNFGFNDLASSAMVFGERWEACEGARFGGRCVVLRPGRYPSLAAMGLNDRVSSVRIIGRNTRIDDYRYAPAPVAAYDARRRNNERLYEANVTSVRAVVGPPERRCWIEREQVTQDQGTANIASVIAAVLGYQVGSGQPEYQDVQRCASVPSQARPDHWDVTYNFRGQEHRMQMTSPPGSTVTVNGKGEPRA